MFGGEPANCETGLITSGRVSQFTMARTRITFTRRGLQNNAAPMRALPDLIRDDDADSSLSFREHVYRRGEQGEMLRDLIALANAPVVGRRYLFLGVDDKPGRARRIPGISARSWKRFCEVLPEFLAGTVEPAIPIALTEVAVDDVLVGAVCLDGCEDKPYLLARRVSANLPAGGGWVRRGTRQRRLLRSHLLRIFAARFKRQEVGDVIVGFPGELPRDEIELPVLRLDDLPSADAAGKLESMLQAKRMTKALLGRTDSRIARLTHARVVGAVPYKELGTKTMQVLLRDIPQKHALADGHYQFELKAHRLNLLLSNHSDKTQADLVLTLKIPLLDGVGVAERVYAAAGSYNPRHRLYPKVDIGPRTITVQVTGLKIPKRGTVEAFIEPLRLLLREAAAGQTIRIGYTLRGPALERPANGRLKIYVTE